MGEDMMKVLSEATVDVALTARVLKISRNAAYGACKAGQIPTIKLGGQFRVPTAKLRVMLGLPAVPAEAA